MKIKFNVKGTEPNQAIDGGKQPPPGVYSGQIHEINHRTDRGAGKEDDLEVIYRIIKDDGKPDATYNRIWDYVGLENDTTEWKRAQFFEAIGEADEKKREGEFDPRRHAEKFNGAETGNKGTKVKIRIKADSYQGEYKGKVAAVLPWEKSADARKSGGSGLFDPAEEDSDPEGETSVADDAGEARFEGEESGEYNYSQIIGMKIVQLRELADTLEIDSEGKRKSELRDEILEELGLSSEDSEDAPF